MSRTRSSIVVLLGALSALTVAAFSPAQELGPKSTAGKAPRVEGTWVARHLTHLSSQTLAFTFAPRPNGSLTATIDLPELRRQQQFGAVTVKGPRVQIWEYGLSLVFDAQVSADGSRLEGKVQMGGAWRPVALTRVDGKPELRRPQEPARPYPYDEGEVTFSNDRANVRLAGTLTLPRGARGPVPAVLLLSGSGPDDRNYLAAGHYPFLVLADYLTRRGVAVLRVDDRGVGKSGGDFSKATAEDFAGDARAAVEYLRRRKEIDPGRIGLIGHSEGASVAGLVAADTPEVAFVVLLAGPGVPGAQLMLRQTELGWKALGANEELVRWNLNLQRQVLEVMRREPDAASADRALRRLYARVNAGLTGEARTRMGVGPTFGVEGQAGSTAGLRALLAYDPRPALAKVRCPVLALNGDKDLIVWSKDSLPEIEKALKAGGNRDYTVRELPGLNHLFQTCKVGSPAEYFLIEETLAPAALEQVGAWIAERTGGGRQAGVGTP